MKKIVVEEKNIDILLIKEAVSVLRKGGIVALPTETVYGLGTVCNNKKSVQRLYRIKKRQLNKPLTLVVADIDRAMHELSTLSSFGYRALEKFWPGPLTIVFYASDSEEKIGVRVPNHVVTQAILRELNIPVYLPSANISGEKEALSADEVEHIFDGKVDLIVDSGSSQSLKSSTVIDLTYHPFKVLRDGAIPLKNLMEVFFKKRVVFVCTGNTCRSPMAEYLLKNSLAKIFPNFIDRYEIISRGIILLEDQPASYETLRVLSDRENVDASSHRSKKIDRYTILSSDLIFVMEEIHRDYIVKLEPTAEPRIFLLSKFLSSHLEKDIADPIGKSITAYEEAYSFIEEAIGELIGWLS